jgi:hypothetical protein
MSCSGFFTEINESPMERLRKAQPRHISSRRSTASARRRWSTHDAEDEVAKLLDQFGWEAEDSGTVEAARAIEPPSRLSCTRARRQRRWSLHGFDGFAGVQSKIGKVPRAISGPKSRTTTIRREGRAYVRFAPPSKNIPQPGSDRERKPQNSPARDQGSSTYALG